MASSFERSTFRIEGLADLEKKLSALNLSVKETGSVVKPALQEAILVAHERIDPHIPVDTGFLKSTHKISKVKKKGTQYYVLDGVSSVDGDQALAQEFGNARTAAQPFLVNNFRASIGEMLLVLKNTLAKGIEAIAKGGKPQESLVETNRRETRRAFKAEQRKQRKLQFGPSRQTLNAAKRKAKQ